MIKFCLSYSKMTAFKNCAVCCFAGQR